MREGSGSRFRYCGPDYSGATAPGSHRLPHLTSTMDRSGRLPPLSISGRTAAAPLGGELSRTAAGLRIDPHSPGAVLIEMHLAAHPPRRLAFEPQPVKEPLFRGRFLAAAVATEAAL